jgi:riboflavin synthase alpha subunit
MFTGIVEEIGRIKNVQRGAKSITFSIEADRVNAAALLKVR